MPNFLGNPDHPISLLAFGTLFAALAFAVFLYWRFMRKPSHRHPMEGQRERNIEEIRSEGGESGKPPA